MKFSLESDAVVCLNLTQKDALNSESYFSGVESMHFGKGKIIIKVWSKLDETIVPFLVMQDLDNN